MLHTFNDPLVALHEITIGLLSQDSTDQLLNLVLDQAIEFTRADSGSIALLDKERKYLEIKVARGLESDISEKVKLKLGQGVTGKAILTGKTKNVGDTSVDPDYFEVREDIKSELAVPLRIGPKSFGVISIDSSRLNSFNDVHEDYIELLARYSAQIITSQQSVANLKHRTHVQDVLITLAGHIGQDSDTNKVFNSIIKTLIEKLGLLRAAIFLFDEVTSELFIVSSHNYSDEEIQKGKYKKGEGITGTVYANQKFISIPDVNDDENFLNKTGLERSDEKTSFFAAPIYLDDNVHGVFTMEMPYDSESGFEDFTFLVQILSSLFSQALQIEALIKKTMSEVQSENILLKRQLQQKYHFDSIIGSSKSMQELFKKMQMSLDSDSSVLIIGESGTGKELIASALHQNSVRKNHNIVKINCAAIPADLLESELFGYSPGAFTGAVSEKKGKFLVAHKGTLFLDEIGEMDLKLQAKLLRFLQEREFTPLGSNKTYNVNVRIIAATNANLEELIKKNLFREDLFYRLNVIQFLIPPLRERKEDIIPLTNFLIAKICKRLGRAQKKISPIAIAKLENYHFPGNVRELENLIERAIVLTAGDELENFDFQEKREINTQTETVENTLAKQQTVIQSSFDLTSWVKSQIADQSPEKLRNNIINLVDKELIIILLRRNLFNKSKTAKLLGINRLTLDKKINELGLIEDMTDE